MIDKTAFNQRFEPVQELKEKILDEIGSFRDQALQELRAIGEDKADRIDDFVSQFDNATITIQKIFVHFLERNSQMRQIEMMEELSVDDQKLFEDPAFDDIKVESAKLKTNYLVFLEEWDDTFLKKFQSNLESIQKSRKDVMEAISRRDVQKNYKSYFR